jgi:UDP-GlcNAc:undecaprenyl-phosphate GlcNAc-1-phosphate transferase
MNTVLLNGALALLVSVVLTALVRALAPRIGAVAVPKADRWHRTQIPLLGGTAVAGAVVIGALLVPVRDHGIWALLGGALTLCLVGLVDDLRPLKPQTKLVSQIIVASVTAAIGLQLRLTGYPVLDVVVTIAWIVGVTNAINLLDNMDGLAAGVAAIAVGFRLAFFLMDGNLEGAAMAAVVLGAVLGFLVFNFNPATIFMGDAGSLFLGVMVSGLSLVGGWPYSRGLVSVLLFPVLILLVPIFDTTFVTIARTLAGRSVSVGGRDHTSHRLVALGLSEREAVLLLYLVALASGGVAYLSYRYGLSYGVVLVCFLGMGLALLGVYLGRLQVYPEDEVRPAENARFFSLIADFPYKRQVATVVIDLGLIILAYYSAYLLRFEASVKVEEPLFVASLPIVIVCQLAAFALWKTYQGIWRYTSLRDLISIVQASAAGTVAAVLVLLFVWRFEGYSRAVFVLDWLLLVGFVGASRLSFRTLAELLGRNRDDFERVLVYGAGDGGALVLRELNNNVALRSRVVGFIDDDRSKHRTQMNGVPVLGGRDVLEQTLATMDVAKLIVSSPKIPDSVVDELRAVCEAAEVPIVRATLRLE